MPDMMGFMPFERAELPEVRVLLGGPDQRLFDYAGGWLQRLGYKVGEGGIHRVRHSDHQRNPNGGALYTGRGR